MYLLYLDGSGSVKNPNERHFILAGIAVFERQIYHLIRRTDQYVEDLKVAPDAELHGSAMANAKAPAWKGIPRPTREAAIEGALDILRDAQRSVVAFAVAVEKRAVSPDDPVEYAFEEICNRFDLFLRRLHSRDGDTNRGLVVMDESHYEDVLQGLAARYREHGTRWGNLRNMAEVPLFVDSTASRLIQLADLLAWAVWRYYEHADARYFNRVVRRFDAEGGVIHGLCHRAVDTADCYCPACMSRKARDSVYPRPPRSGP